MRAYRIAAALAAATFAAALGSAAAQVPSPATAEQAEPAPRKASAPKQAHRRKAIPKPATARAEPAASPLLGGGENSSLADRRRSFFAKPDQGEAAGAPTPDSPVTLGGSNGITPGMGFKF